MTLVSMSRLCCEPKRNFSSALLCLSLVSSVESCDADEGNRRAVEFEKLKFESSTTKSFNSPDDSMAPHRCDYCYAKLRAGQISAEGAADFCPSATIAARLSIDATASD